MSELTVPPRDKINPEHTWNAQSIYPTPEAWEIEFRNVESSVPRLEASKGKLKTNAKTLLEIIKLIEDIESRTNKLMVYASMSHSVDTLDQAAAALNNRMHILAGKVEGAAAFLGPELLTLGRPEIINWTKEEPGLATYAHYFDDLFRKSAHLRSAEVEEISGMLASPFSGTDTIYGSLTDADFRFKPATAKDGKEIPLAQGTIDAILRNPDRKARRTGWENYMDMYVAYKNTLTNTLATSVRQNVFDMQVRKHKSTLEASLFNNNIPVEVFYNLIDVFKKNLPTWHRYWRFRRRTLGVKKLNPYDIWAPLTGSDPHFSYEQVVDFIVEGLAPLGKEYVNALKQGALKERWVDVYPNVGKTAGAFSSGCYGTHPFICMSFTNDIESLSTLAHELGHSMHSYMTWKTQPYIYSGHSIFIAEVASNFHQAMVRANLLETKTEPSFQVPLLEEAMSNFHRYFFIMPTLARFELEVHQRIERGEGLSADDMIDLMTGLFNEGYGGEMNIDRERVGMTWSTFRHLYYDYYVYQYATGISAAHALSNRILSGVKDAAQDYLRFLSAGSSVYPLDALKIAGIDLTTPKPVEETFKVLSGYVDRLEMLCKKS